VADLVQDAVGKGATAVVGGLQARRVGYFYDPTVLADVPDARVS
jgi:succinate-semialdehyde dehydrogenase/glutarate-semialdehyde dehydrogenase